MPRQGSVAASNGQRQPRYNISEVAQGDLNNTASMRKVDKILANVELAHLSLAIPASEEHEADTRAEYRPFLLDDAVAASELIGLVTLVFVAKPVGNGW